MKKDPQAALKTQYDIQVMRPSRIEKVLESHLALTDFTVHRAQHIAFVGESGVGKTAIVTQVHKKLDRFILPLRVSNMDEGQLNGYPVPSRNTGEIELSMVAHYKRKLDKAIKDGKKVTIFFDELNRAKLSHIKTIFNIVDEKMWAGYQLPMDTAFIIAMNPPSEIHNVIDIFGTESALNSRFKLIGVKADLKDFIAYADTKPNFHPLVKEYIKAHPGRLSDFDNMYSGKKYMCPAVIENVGLFLTRVEKSGVSPLELIANEHQDLRDNICSMGGVVAGLEIIDFVSDLNRNLTPENIINSYTQKFRPVIVVDGKMTIPHAELVGLADKVSRYIAGMHLDFKKDAVKGNNLSSFMADLPDPPLATFLETLRTALGDSMDTYLEELHGQLCDFPEFLKALDRMLKLQRKLHTAEF